MSLAALLAAGEIGDEWRQGRTAYGGVSAALALASAKGAHADLPPLRSAQFAFVGPLAGAVTATPTLLRRGKNSAFIGVDITSEDGVGLRALFLFMAPRPSEIAFAPPPAPDFLEPEANLVDPSNLPQGFLTRFDLSMWHSADGVVRRWVRLKDRAGLDPEVELVCIADALPPAAMSLLRRWGPISTTTWQLNIVAPPVTDDGWWLLEAVTLNAADGASSQTMTLWNRAGEAIATATQSIALFV